MTSECANKVLNSNEQYQANRATYIDARTETAFNEFSDLLYTRLSVKESQDTVILCIGSDRVTGDCFGPIVGHMLESSGVCPLGTKIYGTLDKPVHAKNLEEAKKSIYSDGKRPLVVAIDACLGKPEHVGFIGVGEGPVRPGAGLGKKLPEIGDIFVTGVVNFWGVMDFEILRNTGLGLVMRMSEIVHRGVICALKRHCETVSEKRKP